MLDSLKISVHHIGARTGKMVFPPLKKFEQDMVTVLYDADESCINQIVENIGSSKANFRCLPYCIADKEATTTFNINYDHYTSSLKDVNEKYLNYYTFQGDHDYILSDSMRSMEKRKVNVTTLDYLMKSKSGEIPGPNFLSLDTQGAEYEILSGAKETLKNSVVALVVEVGFHELYHNQKLFGEVSQFLADHGFHFVSFYDFRELSASRRPIGQRGNGFTVSADALFLKDIDKIPTTNYSLLLKLAFISIIFNQLEYGLECLSRADALVIIDSQFWSKKTQYQYLTFLNELSDEMKKGNYYYPKTFAEKYNWEESKQRFKILDELNFKTRAKHYWKFKIRQNIKKNFPGLFPYLKPLRTTSRLLRSKITSPFSSPIESIFLKYKLKSQAKVLRENRLMQFRFKKVS